MSDVRTPIALAIADLHLSLTQPACRADKDWLEVQAGYLAQVGRLSSSEGVPILCAGDLFDRWNAPPELIHFALEHLPNEMICVPGQHDLPSHRIEDLHRSAYGVLVKAEKIRNIAGRSYNIGAGWTVVGFGWNQSILSPQTVKSIALIHRYCWIADRSYPGAPEQNHLNAYMKQLKGYQVAVFGDNHHPFLKELKTGTVVLNCGTFIRRKSDEVPYQPSVGIIYDDGTVERRPLNVAGDQFHHDAKQREESALDLKGFIDSLEGLGEHGLNFREAVENHLRSDDLSEEVKEIIKEAMQEHEAG